MVTALRDARFERRLLEFGPASDRVWLAAMGTGLVFTLIAGERRRMASALENGGLFALAIVLGYAAGYVLLEVP